MKKERWIPLLVTAIVGIIMLAGLLSNPYRFDPLFGKGYESLFLAYTPTNYQVGGVNHCLTEDGYLVRMGQTVRYAKLKEISFNSAEFTAHRINGSYWQGQYSPDYIAQHIDRAWYGTFQYQDAYKQSICDLYYMLLLDDGQLLCAEGSINERYPDGIIGYVYALAPSDSQEAYFKQWNQTIAEKEKNFYTQYNRNFYDLWRYLYYKYR